MQGAWRECQSWDSLILCLLRCACYAVPAVLQKEMIQAKLKLQQLEADVKRAQEEGESSPVHCPAPASIANGLACSTSMLSSRLELVFGKLWATTSLFCC